MRKPALRFGIIAAVAVAFAFLAAHPALAQTNQSLSTGNWLLSIFAQVGMYVAEAIGNFVVIILDVTIPVMRYQGFTSSPVVNAGWSIVRDVVNMFFVVVLIIIAMGTIFGHSRFQWKQQVPKLMIFAIVINFSKTLCGIMIDFAQVVMLTFANALKDIAGGNFIQLLGLGDIFSLSEEADAIKTAATGGNGTGPFDYFVAAVAAVFMMVWVLAVVVMLLFVLIYRVVMLWILIVISPLAWFMGGQSVFKSDAYAEWWKNFICYTAIGPVITFFLWLTLAVAGSGFIAATDAGFSSLASGGNLNSNIGGITKIFEFQRLLSFVIGMAMLMVGFDAAAKICSGVKGPGFQAMLNMGKGVPGKIGGYVGGQSRKYGGKALSAGWSGGKSLAAGGATAAGLALAGQGINLRPEAQAQAKRDLAKKGWMPNVASKALLGSASVQQKAAAESMKKAGEEEYKDMDDDAKVEMLARYAKDGMPMTPSGKKAGLGLLAQAIKDPKMREKLEARGALKSLYKTNAEALKAKVRNTAEAKSIEEFEESRPDLTGKVDKIDSTNASKLDPSALTDDEVQDALKGFDSDIYDKDEGRYLTEYEAIEKGKRGKKKQAALRGGKGALYATMTDPVLNTVAAEDLARNWHSSLSGKEGIPQRVFGVDDATWAAMKPGARADVIAAMGPEAARKQNAARVMMSAKGTRGSLRTGGGADLAASLSREDIQQMMVAYKKASPAEQEEMEAMFEDVEAVLAERAKIPAGSVDEKGRPQHTTESATASARRSELTSALSDAQKSVLKPLQKSYEDSQKEFGEIAAQLADAEDAYQRLEDLRVDATQGLAPGATNYLPNVRAAIERAEAAQKSVEALRAKLDDVQARADAKLAQLNSRKLT